MAEEEDHFSFWLASRLKALNTDETVFGPYILSILKEEDCDEDTIEVLDGILGDLSDGIDAASLRDEILSKWHLYLTVESEKDQPDPSSQQSNVLGDQLDEILRLATESTESSSSRKNGDTDPKLRAAILSTLGKSTDSEGDEERLMKKKGEDSFLPDVGRNANVEKVLNEQREIKEKSRIESAKKKERDKEDRIKQKAVAQDRKDKAKKKSAKVERKR